MKILFLLLISFYVFGCTYQQKKAADLHKWVNPYIGTTYSTTPSVLKHQELANESKGQTFPATGVPYAMTNWTPQTQATEQKCIPPYYYHDEKIQGFRGSHWMSGSCTQDYGSVTIMPLGQDLMVNPEERASSFDHDNELTTPSYYSVYLKGYNAKVEMTGTARCGILRITFDEEGDKYIILEPNSDEGEGLVKIDTDKRSISGTNPVHRIYQGWGEPAGFSGHFFAEFNKEFDAYGTWNGNDFSNGSHEEEGKGKPVGAFVMLNVEAGEQVLIKIGTSFTGIEGAENNLKKEIMGFDFNKVQKLAENEWQKHLNQIVVEGGTPDERTMFYSALYHAKLLPRIFNDADGSYPGFAEDNNVYRTDDYNYYVDFTTWDSYRAVHPLMNIIEPSRSSDIIKSIINKAEQGGWLPIFPCWNHYTAGMIGDHLISVIGDAYVKGIDDFDIEKAYQYMRKNAFEVPDDYQDYKNGKGRRALESYLRYGYIPLEDSVPEAFHKNEQVSRTLEYAYAMMAGKTNNTDDYEELLSRAKNYKNVFDTTVGFARGRFKDGTWIKPFDPYSRQSYITEGTPYQYTWYVPHDIAGLINLMGGKETFINKLDQFFEKDEYWHGNEPSHHIAYLYPFGGAPWKTQKIIRDIIMEEYSNEPGGISGNDDVGQMSAWLVFSMAGFYPVTPGMPVYIIGSPLFDKITFNLENGRQFIIETVNNSTANRFIQSATYNGSEFTRSYLLHDEIMNGGKLVLKMGVDPNTEWASSDNEKPPSLFDHVSF